MGVINYLVPHLNWFLLIKGTSPNISESKHYLSGRKAWPWRVLSALSCQSTSSLLFPSYSVRYSRGGVLMRVVLPVFLCFGVKIRPWARMLLMLTLRCVCEKGLLTCDAFFCAVCNFYGINFPRFRSMNDTHFTDLTQKRFPGVTANIGFVIDLSRFRHCCVKNNISMLIFGR